ncbi:MAG: 3'(2'),5'-bisphosphate nucleotidase CysQ [Alcanivoracaceae bacterium]|nr:3'(2'),5'-bisphosphate nucleotidase CysQ [Alcanivoracaceae bacterium]
MIDLLNKIEQTALKAGKAILEIYNSADFGVEIKSDDSPLTKADLAAHNIIVADLQNITPDVPILSEESADIAFAKRSQWNKYWLVDPLDGTKEFIKRNGEFTVNIALIENGHPILSVVYVPVQDITYTAAKGYGAFKKINDNRQQINTHKPARNTPVVVGSRSHISEDVKEYLDKLGEHEMTAMGSSLKFCLVAEGKADLYPRLGLTSEWDTAAAQCIVEQAGGRVVTLDDEALLYNKKDSLLNPYFMVYGDSNREWINI